MKAIHDRRRSEFILGFSFGNFNLVETNNNDINSSSDIAAITKTRRHMSQLVSFVAAKSDTVEVASKMFSIYNGTSPFQNGVQFTISGFAFKVSKSYDYSTKKESVGERPFPVLETSIGNLFVKVLRDQFDKDGEQVETDGDLNKHLKELLKGSPKTDSEILQSLVDFCKGKKLVVRRSKPFETINNYTGKRRMTSLVNIDIVAD